MTFLQTPNGSAQSGLVRIPNDMQNASGIRCVTYKTGLSGELRAVALSIHSYNAIFRCAGIFAVSTKFRRYRHGVAVILARYSATRFGGLSRLLFYDLFSVSAAQQRQVIDQDNQETVV